MAGLKEFIRVESSKLLLAILIVFFVLHHVDDRLVWAAWSALLVLTDIRRYPRT